MCAYRYSTSWYWNVDSLQAEQTNNAAVGILLDILERRDDRDLEKFYECLVRSKQEHVVRLILDDTLHH